MANLDPKAQEFIPTTRTKPVFFSPPPPPLPPPPPPPLPLMQHQLFYPFPPQPPLPPQLIPHMSIVVGYPHPQYTVQQHQHTTSSISAPPPSATPTRAIMLTSVSADVSESIIRRELEVFGDIRGVQMERLRDGIVTIYFYDLRHAEMALKAIREQHYVHQKSMNPETAPFGAFKSVARGLVAGRAAWAQFVLPSRRAVTDGHNQGSLVVFNLDPNVTTESLREIFQVYGEIKELRETPFKRQQRFVEFYDIREASKALKEMNGKEIFGKQVVVEFSRPGGYTRRCIASIATRFKPALPIIRPGFNRNRSPPNIPPRLANLGNGGSLTERMVRDSMKCLSIGNKVLERVSDGRVVKRNLKKEKEQPKSKVPWKGKERKRFDDARFLIDEDGSQDSSFNDSRTTVMIKNIPNKYSQQLFLNMLDNHCIHCNEQIENGDHDQPLSSYDFVYLPIDFTNKCNVGYGFVNMTSPEAALRLYKAFHNQHWEVFNSKKICEVTYARVQGLEALKEHFKNSKFPCEMDHYLPVSFSPPRNGKQLAKLVPLVSCRSNDLQQKTGNVKGYHDHDQIDDDDDDDLQ